MNFFVDKSNATTNTKKRKITLFLSKIIEYNILYIRYQKLIMNVAIESSWNIVLQQEFEKHYFKELVEFIKNEYKTTQCFPAGKNIFAAFNATPFSEVKVVLLGQDPYHNYSQANGLCFSVSDKVQLPPSLQNIFKELYDDVSIYRTKGDLNDWAKQGIFLLNTTLTVRAHIAGSHQNKGWETFTDEVIAQISSRKEKIIFVLWGNFAQKKKTLIDKTKHFIIESAHPSPLSAYRGFFGSKPFSKINKILEENNSEIIRW